MGMVKASVGVSVYSEMPSECEREGAAYVCVWCWGAVTWDK